jgi:hypothetical protein
VIDERSPPDRSGRAAKRIYRQAGSGKEALSCKADRDDRVRPEAREQKDRENEEVCGGYDKENEEVCGRNDKDGYARAQAGHLQGPPEPMGPTRVRKAFACGLHVFFGPTRHNRHVCVRAGPLRSRLPLRYALECAVLRSSTRRILDPSSSPSWPIRNVGVGFSNQRWRAAEPQ